MANLQLKAYIKMRFWFQSDFHPRYQLVMKHNQRYYTKVHDALFVLWLSASLQSGHYTLAGILFIRPLNIISHEIDLSKFNFSSIVMINKIFQQLVELV